MKSLVFVSLAVAFIAQGSSAASGSCHLYSACSSCAGAKGCGWDAGMSKCKVGTVYGPNIGSATKWEWSVDQCLTVVPNSQGCHTKTHCDSCVEFSSGCGWDGRLMKCMAGNSTGPANAKTPSAQAEWSWIEDQCPPTADCSQYSGCAACTLSSSGDCGWNALSLMCVSGTAHGPAGTTSSPNAGWKFTNAQCTSPVSHDSGCGAHTTCYNCTRSATATCGWTGKRCLQGTPAGPSDAMQSTSFWGWTSDKCQQSTLVDGTSCSASLGQCDLFTNCMDCVDVDASLGCSWDSFRSKCASTYSISSSDNYVPNGSPAQCVSATADCSSHSSCGGCTSDISGICGWDGASFTCRQGTASGPLRGQTRQWQWKKATCPVLTKCSQLLTSTSCQAASIAGVGYCKWVISVDAVPIYYCAGIDSSATAVDASDVVVDCGTSTDCVACADRSGCGWDYNAQICKPGTSVGPNTGSLPKQWDYTADQCGTEQCGGTCASLMSCGACATSVNCGWDSYSDSCKPGTLAGPAHPSAADNDFSSASNWQYGIAACDYVSCSEYFTCYDCTDNSGCGWSDGDGGMCSKGNSAGPFVNNGFDTWKTSQSSCGMTWSFRFNSKSMSMWLTFGLLFGCCFITVAVIRRNNRRQRMLRANAVANAPLMQQSGVGGAPTTAVLAGGAAAPALGTTYGSTAHPYGAATYAAAPTTIQQDANQVDGGNSCHAMPMMEDIA